MEQIAKDTMPNMDQESLELYKAYVDGINDFLNNINLMVREGSTTARLLPPEFYFFNLTTVEPWTVVDVIAISKYTCFRVIGSWSQELVRDIIAQTGIRDLVD